MRPAALLLLLVAALAPPAPAAASIPPIGWVGPRWNGPGLLCASGFTLDLEAGERATQGYPSVGQIRFTVESPSGTFEIVEDWFSGRLYPDRRAVRRLPGGTLYRLLGKDDGQGRAFLFMPANAKIPTVVRFGARDGGKSALNEKKVLRRIGFATTKQAGCLEEEKRA